VDEIMMVQLNFGHEWISDLRFMQATPPGIYFIGTVTDRAP
jgi:hypothetical protein